MDRHRPVVLQPSTGAPRAASPVAAAFSANAAPGARSARYGVLDDAAPRLFPGLESTAYPAETIARLVSRMVDRAEPLAGGAVSHDNAGLPSGYSVLAQFVNHDLSYAVEAGETPRRRPRLNLDSLYGRSSSRPANVYESARDSARRFRLGASRDGRAVDLPRDERGIAQVPDRRNDNNLLVAQFSALFMRLHNALLDGAGMDFAAARRETVLLFQRVVLDDLLPMILHAATERDVRRNGPRLFVVDEDAAIPLEFSEAAYRLHTLNRSRYRLNRQRHESLASLIRLTGYAQPQNFPLVPDLVVDWSCFFPSARRRARFGASYNVARRFDPLIAEALHDVEIDLPRAARRALGVPYGFRSSLVLVDALRGNGVLPSAQDILGAVRERGLTMPSLRRAQLADGRLDRVDARLVERTPLFYYLLREAELLGEGRRLGPLGSRIVAETLHGLLLSDADSILNTRGWTAAIPTAVAGRVTMVDVLAYIARQPAGAS